MEDYKRRFNIEYFTMFEHQINRKIKLTDFKESFKIVDTLSNWIKDTSLHYKKQPTSEISYDFKNNNIILTIKIPYKTEN